MESKGQLIAGLSTATTSHMLVHSGKCPPRPPMQAEALNSLLSQISVFMNSLVIQVQVTCQDEEALTLDVNPLQIPLGPPHPG